MFCIYLLCHQKLYPLTNVLKSIIIRKSHERPAIQKRFHKLSIHPKLSLTFLGEKKRGW